MLYLFATTPAMLAAEINADEATAAKHEKYVAELRKNTENKARLHWSYAAQMRARAKKKREMYNQRFNKTKIVNKVNPVNTVSVSTPVTINNTNKNENSFSIVNSAAASPQTTVEEAPTSGFVPLEGQKIMETTPAATTPTQPAPTASETSVSAVTA